MEDFEYNGVKLRHVEQHNEGELLAFYLEEYYGKNYNVINING